MIDDSFVWGLCWFTIWRCTSLPEIESCS